MEKVLKAPNKKTPNPPENKSVPIVDRFVGISESKVIDDKDSNHIFFFGKPQIGKSAILATMLFYMNARAGSIKPKPGVPNSKAVEVLLFDMLDNLKRGILPSRTETNKVSNIELIFEPNNRSKKVKPINLTFLEMSGEDLKVVRQGDPFINEINNYLNEEIPITFIMVTDYEDAAADDILMISFLQKLQKEQRKFKKVNAILLVSKWDKSNNWTKSNKDRIPSEKELNNFFEEHMPMTNQQADHYELFKTYYTAGTVIKNDSTGKDTDQLQELDLTSAETLTGWLYQSITGVDINYEGTWWERFKESLFG